MEKGLSFGIDRRASVNCYSSGTRFRIIADPLSVCPCLCRGGPAIMLDDSCIKRTAVQVNVWAKMAVRTTCRKLNQTIYMMRAAENN